MSGSEGAHANAGGYDLLRRATQAMMSKYVSSPNFRLRFISLSRLSPCCAAPVIISNSRAGAANLIRAARDPFSFILTLSREGWSQQELLLDVMRSLEYQLCPALSSCHEVMQELFHPAPFPTLGVDPDFTSTF